MKKRNLVAIILAAASAGLAVLAYFLLPETVVIQFSIGSSGNSTAPKLFALLVPTALGIGGAVASLFSKEDAKAAGKGIFVSVLGIGLCIFTVVVNFFVQ